MTLIRPCRSPDLAAVTAIYARQVLHGTGTFETEPPSLTEMMARHAEVLTKQLPYLVAEEAGEIMGFACCNWFKARPAYRYSAEDSIYVLPKAQQRGLGRALLTELATRAEAAGVRKLIAVIGDSANAGSIGLHRSVGFQPVGVLTSCGWKFDRWLDVVLMEMVLGAGDSRPP
jgi:L-amino acid N-acyltransferase YncA